MFCRNCGSNAPDGSQFCAVCGSAMNSYSEAAPTIVTEIKPSPITYAKQKTNIKPIISIILVVAIIGLSIFSYLNYFADRKEDDAIPTMFWVFSGITLALVVALIINLISGKGNKNSETEMSSATYSISVNPTVPISETPDVIADSTINSDVYNTYTNKSVNTEPILHTDAMTVSVPISNSDNAFSTQYADSASRFNVETKKISDDSDVVRTKYAPSTVAEVKKDVEIVFSAEADIPTVNSEEYTFVPGTTEVSATVSTDTVADIKNEDTQDTFKVIETPSAPVINSVNDVSDVSEISKYANAPDIYEAPPTFETNINPETETPVATEVKAEKPSSGPFFKSAGDL